MKTLALLAIFLALPLAAETPVTQTLPTPDEIVPYAALVIADLSSQVALMDDLRTHRAGFNDLEARDAAHAERVAALKALIAKHNACEGGDWNFSKREWACPLKSSPAQ